MSKLKSIICNELAKNDCILTSKIRENNKYIIVEYKHKSKDHIFGNFDTINCSEYIEKKLKERLYKEYGEQMFSRIKQYIERENNKVFIHIIHKKNIKHKRKMEIL